MNSQYTLSDKNGVHYILRSLNSEDASGIWFESLSRLNPEYTEVSRIPVSHYRLSEIVANNKSIANIWLAVARLDDPKVHVANIHIGPIDFHHRMTFFGRYVFEPYRSLGLGTAISKLVIKYCFNELNLRKVKAGNIGNNLAARKSNEKAGMILDYIEKNSYYHNGCYNDAYIYSTINNNFV